MALNTFGWTPSEVTTDSAGNVISGVTLTVFTDVTKSNQVTGLFDKDGTTALPSGVVVSDNKGRFGFKASDAYSMLYVYDGSTADPWPIAAHEALDQGMASHAQAVADAQAAADSAAQSANLVGAPADTAIATAVNGTGTQTRTALDGRYAAQDGRIVANDRRYGTPGTRAALINALDAAETAGQGTVVFLTGVWDVGNGLSMNGRTSQLRGAGAGGTQATPAGTVIHATTQAGPVIDWSGWVRPQPGFAGKVTHGGFLVRGSGVADPTKANSGMKFTALSSTTFADIAIRDTGGPCIDMAQSIGNAVYLCDFERIVLMEPISSNTNDVPFLQAVEANGNRFRSFGLRSFSTPCAPSGAVKFTGNASYAGHDNLFDGWWFEGLWVPSGGTLFEHAGNAGLIEGFQFFDCPKVDAGATGTSYIRLTNTAAANFGGNLVRGVIPGKGTGATDIDMGVDVRQSNNRIEGVKGYRGTNVTIAAGVQNTHVNLGGAYSTATDPAVIDNSGNTTNTVEDNYSKTVTRPAVTFKQGTAGYTLDQVTGGAFAGMPRFSDPATPANGGVIMGTSGTRWQAAGVGMTGTGDSFTFRDIALGSLFKIDKTTVRGVTFFDAGAALPTASVTWRGKVVMVQGAAGVADRLVICRKDAADAYAWVDLF